MLEPEQIMHALMILNVESTIGLDDSVMTQMSDHLGCPDEDMLAAGEHIEKHRDDGDWGGRRAAVLERSLKRVDEGLSTGRLPEEGTLSQEIRGLMQEHAPEDEDDGEVDPFEELGVVSGAAGASDAAGAAVAADDLLAAFMDDDDEEEPMLSDDTQFFGEQEDSDEEAEAEEESEESEPEEEPEPESQEMSPVDAYELLLSTCWVDGILDPAEAKLLARKRLELTITFETHLKLLREMLERES